MFGYNVFEIVSSRYGNHTIFYFLFPPTVTVEKVTLFTAFETPFHNKTIFLQPFFKFNTENAITVSPVLAEV